MSDKPRPSRRQVLLGDRPGNYAIARHVRMTPQKVRRVVDMVRGMDAMEAITALEFAPQAASEPVRKVVASAVANAENVDMLRRDELYISQIFVDEGMTMRRIRPRAKGSASRILKRGSHITVVVEPKDNDPVVPISRRDVLNAAKADSAAEVSEPVAEAPESATKTSAKKADAPKSDAPKKKAKKASDDEKGA